VGQNRMTAGCQRAGDKTHLAHLQL
jgi:hypothetical protein